MSFLTDPIEVTAASACVVIGRLEATTEDEEWLLEYECMVAEPTNEDPTWVVWPAHSLPGEGVTLAMAIYEAKRNL